MGRVITIRRPGPDDWRQLRTIRLAALAEAPSAFGSTLAREFAFDEATWRSRLASTALHFADDDGQVVGLAAGFREPDGSIELVSMWVDPRYRGRGVGELLVRAIMAWAHGAGVSSISLWVTSSNDAARRLYERCGFRLTGETQPLPSDPSLGEQRLSAELR